MFNWLHRLGSSKIFFEISGRWQVSLLSLSLLMLAGGSVWALLFVPPDYQQGNSVRIMYIHVPAAILAQSIYVMMAGAAAIFLIWRIKLADIAVKCIAPVGVIALRSAMARQASAGRACAILALVGVVNLPVIKFSVEWWYTLHQPASFSLMEKPAMPTEMWLPLLVMVFAFYLFFFAILILRIRNEILVREKNADWVKRWLEVR